MDIYIFWHYFFLMSHTSDLSCVCVYIYTYIHIYMCRGVAVCGLPLLVTEDERDIFEA
jgi:hypothetical protein